MKAAVNKKAVFWTLGQNQRTVEFAFTRPEPKPTIYRIGDYRPSRDVLVASAGKVRA